MRSNVAILGGALLGAVAGLACLLVLKPVDRAATPQGDSATQVKRTPGTQAPSAPPAVARGGKATPAPAKGGKSTAAPAAAKAPVKPATLPGFGATAGKPAGSTSAAVASVKPVREEVALSPKARLLPPVTSYVQAGVGISGFHEGIDMTRPVAIGAKGGSRATLGSTHAITPR